MPRPPGHTIFVQQDGAKPHMGWGVMEATQVKVGTASSWKPGLPTRLTSRERSWFLPLHPAAEGGCGSDLV
ncbi:unnamed protein product [Discosporangium mesarthrocarpum]